MNLKQRKHLSSHSEYETFNYLYDHRPQHLQCIPEVGVQTNKFNRGFTRRQLHTINPTEQRDQLNIRHQLRHEKTGRIRKETIAKHEASQVIVTDSNENGNNNIDNQSHKLEWLQCKRHADHRSTGEDVNFDGRFNVKRIQAKSKKLTAIDEHYRNRCHSSILGVGRPNLPSKGVYDAFDEHESSFSTNNQQFYPSSILQNVELSAALNSRENKLRNTVSSIFTVGNETPVFRYKSSAKTASQIGFLFGTDEKR